MTQKKYKCKLRNCILCPYPYCLDGDLKEDADEVIKVHKQIQHTKTDKERKREAWRRWYQRNTEAERLRGLINYRRRTG